MILMMADLIEAAESLSLHSTPLPQLQIKYDSSFDATYVLSDFIFLLGVN